ncbi:MAG: DUF370 domain-containing protein [Oscillospiraceae bacterium]|jgi:hypothetical protein|nr:DUF370 domain-containing protein [Oscillospiraceae bacterium]
MYLILGRDEGVPEDEVIGVFDLDNVSWSHKTREYLSAAEKSGRLRQLSDGLPKTLIVMTERDILAQASSTRLTARKI